MEIPEAVAQLRAAEQTAKALSDAAAAQGALTLTSNGTQREFIDAIDAEKDGKYSGSVGGQEAKKAQPGARTIGEATERFAKPIILSESPDSIGLTTPASTVLFAGQHIHATTQTDLHAAAAHTHATTAGEAASWFSHAGGIKSIAAAGSHTLQAHTDALELLADDSVTITSSNDEIHILAKDSIVLRAGQSSVTIQGMDITFACPGTFSVKGMNKSFEGPGFGASNLDALPNELVEVRHWIGLDYRDPVLDTGIDGAGYEIHFADTQVLTGTLDAAGQAEHLNVDNKAVKKVVYKPRSAKQDKPHAALRDLLG